MLKSGRKRDFEKWGKVTTHEIILTNSAVGEKNGRNVAALKSRPNIEIKTNILNRPNL
jgi:hypothetical protein